MNNECETLEQVDAVEQDHQAEVDLYRTMARLEYLTDRATARAAAEALREACAQGRLYGLSYGYKEDHGYVACVLGHLGHAADPIRYERDGQAALCALMDYPYAGYKVEEYCMYVPQGSKPEHNQYVANISNWLDNYLNS